MPGLKLDLTEIVLNCMLPKPSKVCSNEIWDTI